jgi:outer membrane protein OmpA-like peptidoglycan-associated protein
MTGFGKFLVGTAVTSLLAFGAHQMSGDGYVNGLEEGARGALAAGGYDGIDLNMQREPLSRVALLSGTDDPDMRAKIEADVLASGNVSSVQWTTDAAEADTAVAAAPSEEAVADCQSRAEALMDGKSINFATGSAAIDASSDELIGGVAALVAECEGMMVGIGGHTDSTGNADANQTLSQARADAVASTLTERGIAADRFAATGYGSTQLKVADDGANAANRRIEFTFSAPEGTTPEGGE